jgi:hypothetical protein
MKRILEALGFGILVVGCMTALTAVVIDDPLLAFRAFLGMVFAGLPVFVLWLYIL